jgi:plastocyanin
VDPSPAERRSTCTRAPRFAAHIVVTALALGAAGCAATGSIRGTLAILPPPERADSTMIARGASATDLASVTNAVVFVVRDRESKPRPGRWWNRERMRQTPTGFEPRVIAIAAGTTVQFENRDSIYHNIMSVTPAKRYDSGLYAPGQRCRILFDRPGVVSVFCELHPGEAGFVVVRSDRLFARPDAFGEFRLPRLAAGTYTVKAWHPTCGETSQRVRVPRKGRTIVRLAL